MKVTFSSSSVIVKLPGLGPTPEQEWARQVAASSPTELTPVERDDRVVMAAPAAAHALRPRLRDPLLTQPLLDEGDEVEHAGGHQVVQHLPLVLHLRAQAPGLLEVARVDRLDRTIHRRARELRELLL